MTGEKLSERLKNWKFPKLRTSVPICIAWMVAELEAERDTLKEQIMSQDYVYLKRAESAEKNLEIVNKKREEDSELIEHQGELLRKSEDEVKTLRDRVPNLEYLTIVWRTMLEERNADYLRVIKEKVDAKDRLANAQAHLKMTIDSLEDGRPQVTHSYYVACIRVRLGDLAFILKGVKAQTQSDEALGGEG